MFNVPGILLATFTERRSFEMTQLSDSESEENIKKIGREISAAISTGNCVLLTGLGFSLFRLTKYS